MRYDICHNTDKLNIQTTHANGRDRERETR